MITLSSVCKTHDDGHEVLRGISADFAAGSTNAICGRSGSGKTTLLHILASFWEPTSGAVEVDGRNIATLSEAEKNRYRRDTVGYVYQSHFLIPTLNAEDNIGLVARLGSDFRQSAFDRTDDILKRIGMYDKRKHYPHELSGGEQQRIGIARALVNEQKIVLADEPSGNLDHQTGEQTMDLLFEASALYGATVVIATHSKSVAERVQNKYFIEDGLLVDREENVTW